VKSLARRIGKIEERERLREAELGPSHLIVAPDDWPEADRLAYDALAESGEFGAWADLLEKHPGQRPRPRTRVIAFRLRADGPQ
jgi:hypothetical protein